MEGFVSTVTREDGIALRSTHVTYDVLSEKNRQLSFRREKWIDNGSPASAANRYRDVEYSDFDGAGNFRVVTTSSNYQDAVIRTERTQYNADGLPDDNDPWVLKTFTYREVVQGAHQSKVETCFDTDTGFLLRRRVTTNGSSRGPRDVVTVYDETDGGQPTGNVLSERYYGGDLAANLDFDSKTDLCDLALPATDTHHRQHEYDFGVRARSEFLNAAGVSLGFRYLDQTLDWDTGLAAVSRDSAGLATSFDYDAMGRLVAVDPSEEARVSFTYTYGPPKVDVKTLDDKGTVLARRKVTFDGLGRVWKDAHLRADGGWSDVIRGYNELGWKKFDSELTTEGTGINSRTKTEYLAYDPFRRAHVIRPFEGASRDLNITSFGDSFVSRSHWVATGLNTATGAIQQQKSPVGQVFDDRGRLVEVRELQGSQVDPSTPTVFTKYEYDEGDRLVRVDMIRPEGTQVRTFTYDGRGLLRSETHPEKTGLVKHLRYDALGNVGRTQDTENGPNDLTFLYDRAGRLTEVKETSGNVLKQFEYGTSGRAKGKLEKSTRYNHFIFTADWKARVIQEYRYDGVQGRVDRLKTTFDYAATGNGNLQPLEEFLTHYTYDEQGQLTSLSYPTRQLCLDGCPNEVLGLDTFEYENGFLTDTSVTSGTPSMPGISYHPNGLVDQVKFGNGVTQTVDRDPNGYGRPLRIYTSGVQGVPSNWHSGDYVYDGSGNVAKIGNDYFLYDTLHRLKESNLSLGGSGNAHHAYTYDSFGNLKEMIPLGSVAGQSIPVDWQTNRLLGASAYDNAGNALAWNQSSLNYDALNRLVFYRSGATGAQGDWRYIYDADGERLASEPWDGGQMVVTVRDLGGKVLREWKVQFGAVLQWAHHRDFHYRGDTLLAVRGADLPGGTAYFHPDHLGSARLVTDHANAQVLESHTYMPFGREASELESWASTERIKFTGHERDIFNALSIYKDALDYMHARYYNPLIGRFLTVDPVTGSPEAPQSWNRYAYARNNSLKYVDPDGRVVETAWDVANIGIGVASFVKNVRDGNVLGALVDAGGIVLDTTAAVVPVVPGGVGTAIKVARLADRVDDAGDASRSLSRASDVVKSSSRAERRAVMRKEGIPTSQQPSGQSSPRGPGNKPAGRQLEFDTPDGRKVVQHQLQDRNHDPHWEAGRPKPGGQTDPAGRPRLQNEKSKI